VSPWVGEADVACPGTVLPMDQARYRWYLDELTRWAGAHPSVIGLVTLGSAAGLSHAPDEWSDHDVWVVTLEGTATPLRNDPSWLPDAESILGWFVETAHGRSAVYEDGHLVEVAIFEDPELELARANDFRVLYDRGGIEVRLERIAANTAAEGGNQADLAAGRFLVEMIIGLGRLGRGELLSAGELIRGRAVASLLRTIGGEHELLDDLDPLRRVEMVYPALAERLSQSLSLPLVDGAQSLVDIAEEYLPRTLLSPAAVQVLRMRIDRVRSVL
jgi:lincosamide nucleotidyltransferase B/F